jgi:hypothetical protein
MESRSESLRPAEDHEVVHIFMRSDVPNLPLILHINEEYNRHKEADAKRGRECDSLPLGSTGCIDRQKHIPAIGSH